MKSLALAYAMKKKKMSGSKKMDDMDMPMKKMDEKKESGKMSDDLVDRIMAKRYSKGGMVANGGEDDFEDMADSKPNEFDYLALEDTLEPHIDEDFNEHGDEQEMMDRHDIVARIMKSRMKKDKMPRPA